MKRKVPQSGRQWMAPIVLGQARLKLMEHRALPMHLRKPELKAAVLQNNEQSCGYSSFLNHTVPNHQSLSCAKCATVLIAWSGSLQDDGLEVA